MLVAVDWGTSSFRAWLLDEQGAVLRAREEPLGILKVPGGAFGEAFDTLLGDWIDETGAPAIAAGMIGSRQGWIEAPYAFCPAGLADLAGALATATSPRGRKLAIIPGVARDGEIPDVMRGEETQIAGDGLPDARAVYLLPGTHSKWALVEGGRIAWFTTFMTGELFAALSEHTILARLMDGRAFDADGFARGLAASAEEGLLGRLFSARTLGLFGRLPGKASASDLSGLLIGHEIREARAALGGRVGANLPEIGIIGRHDLADAYRRALSNAGLAAREAPAATTAGGLLAVARAAGLVKGTA
jgi:2-dehydro-3-deoxygalactonokinase